MKHILIKSIGKESKDSISMDKIILYIIVLITSAVCLKENFVLVSDFSILSIHGIDDIAFSISIDNIYNKKNFLDLLNCNDYGYGWIFWISEAVFTFPGMLLHQIGWGDTLYILLPRLYSMLFSILGSYVMYKLSSIYIKNKWLVVVATLMYPLFPTLMHFSQRIGTTSVTAFFSILTIYLLVKEKELSRKYFFLSCLSLAFCLGIKLTSICVIPVFIMLMISRFNYKFTKENFKLWLKYGLFNGYVCLFLISPSIALAPFMRENAKASIAALLFFAKNTAGNELDLKSNIINGMLGGFTWIPITILMIVMFIVFNIIAYKNKYERKNEYLSLFIGYICGGLILCIMASNGFLYVINYGLTISFIPYFSLALLDKLNKNILAKIVFIASCIILIFSQYFYILHNIKTQSTYNIFAFSQNERNHQEDKELSLKLKTSVKNNFIVQDNSLSIISDWTLPAFFNQLVNNNVAFYSIWENIETWECVNPQIIVLDKRSNTVKDELYRKQLFETGDLLNKKWHKFEENDIYVIFICDELYKGVN